MKHALKALSGCVTGDKELDVQGVTIAIVGKVSAFEVADETGFGCLDVRKGDAGRLKQCGRLTVWVGKALLLDDGDLRN